MEESFTNLATHFTKIGGCHKLNGYNSFFHTLSYQGFASGDLDEDATSIRMFEQAGLDMFVAQSFAKNMGLYGERTGTFSVICSNPSTAANVSTQLEAIIRPMYSSPPR